MGIAQHGRGNVNGMNFCAFKAANVWQGAVAYGTAHIENSSRFEFGVLLLEPGDGAVTHVGVIHAHLAHGINVDCTVVNGTLSNIVFYVLGVITPGLAVDINGGVISRNL